MENNLLTEDELVENIPVMEDEIISYAEMTHEQYEKSKDNNFLNKCYNYIDSLVK